MLGGVYKVLKSMSTKRRKGGKELGLFLCSVMPVPPFSILTSPRYIPFPFTTTGVDTDLKLLPLLVIVKTYMLRIQRLSITALRVTRRCRTHAMCSEKSVAPWPMERHGIMIY